MISCSRGRRGTVLPRHPGSVGRALGMLVAAVFAFAFLCDPAGAGDIKAGRKKASKCQVCHGYDGIGKDPEVPHIAGESDIYLIRQLRAFRSGKRKHPQMSIIARSLSDEDIADLAAYYAAIRITVEMPDSTAD